MTAQLATLLATPKPSYSIDGQSVSWSEHYRALLDSQAKLRQAILELEDPWEFTIEATP